MAGGAAGLTVLLALPNLIWQARHGFISVHFLQSIHARDIRNGRGKSGPRLPWPEFRKKYQAFG